MKAALSKYRVLDLSRILAGPWASQMLADLGAEVIKVERPGSGDDTRGWGPPFIGEEDHRDAAYFHGANRGKKSIAIDITSPEGQQLIKQLAANSDVLIENYKVGGLKKYGLDYQSLKAINPELVYCSITGFGQTGPYAQRAGYDFMIQAMGGLMSVTGESDGMPMKVGVALADVMTGLYATNAIQAALLYREQTGVGQHIDLGLLDVQVATLANQAMNYLASGEAPGRLGNAHPNIVPYQAFATEDGHMILAVGNDSQFGKFCELAGAPQLSADPQFATNQARVQNRDQLVPQIQELMKMHTSAWWLEQLAKVGVPCGPINSIDEVFADPQVKHRQMQVELRNSDGETVPAVANPIKLSETPVRYENASPKLAQHTEQVLQQCLSMNEQQIQQLKDQGIIQ